jgi:four helix bundle protein
LLDKLPRTASVRNQLDRASTSIPLNIAEGNGRFTSADRCHFFDMLVALRSNVPLVST